MPSISTVQAPHWLRSHLFFDRSDQSLAQRIEPHRAGIDAQAVLAADSGVKTRRSVSAKLPSTWIAGCSYPRLRSPSRSSPELRKVVGRGIAGSAEYFEGCGEH
jgi:hypothetical protein